MEPRADSSLDTKHSPEGLLRSGECFLTFYLKYSAPDSNSGWCLSPGMFRPTKSPYRSECPILPNTRPSGEKMPSMAMMEPLGLTVDVHGGDARPRPHTGWPPGRSAIRSAARPRGGHEAALAVGDGDGVQVAHLGTSASRGSGREATRVVTYRLWWRPIGVVGQGGAADRPCRGSRRRAPAPA